jgi:hypothetical protein
MSDKKVYNVEDIFHDIPGDPDNVMLQLPPEICKELNWEAGTVLKVSVTETGIVLEKKDADNGKK